MIQTKEELFLAELGINTKEEFELAYGAKIKITDLLKKYEKQLTLTDVVSTYNCESYDFKRQGRRCAKQCDSCEWMEKKQ